MRTRRPVTDRVENWGGSKSQASTSRSDRAMQEQA